MTNPVVVLIPAYSHIDFRLNSVLRKLAYPVLTVYGCSDLVKARSRLLTDALNGNAERILFLDSDMVPTAEQLEQLVSSERVNERECVTGCYFTQPTSLAAVAADNGDISLNGKQRYVEGVVAGMGCACVHRSTIAEIAARLPQVTDALGDKWHPFFLPFVASHDVQGLGRVNEYYPEDYSFWWRVRVLGEAQLWIDTHLVVGHVRQTILGGESVFQVQDIRRTGSE